MKYGSLGVETKGLLSQSPFVLVCFLALGLLAGQNALSVEFNPITTKDISRFQAQFGSGHSPSKDELQKKSAWNCKLFGVRSRMQADRKNEFYKFSPGHENSWMNQGVQIIKSYEKKSDGLEGRQGPIVDVVRVLPDGKIMGEVSIEPGRVSKSQAPGRAETKSVVRPERPVLLYSVCS